MTKITTDLNPDTATSALFAARAAEIYPVLVGAIGDAETVGDLLPDLSGILALAGSPGLACNEDMATAAPKLNELNALYDLLQSALGGNNLVFPMTGTWFTDAAGTTAPTGYGQEIECVRAMSGAIFATQTTTNAKPRNAVQPASGVRNLLQGDTDTMTTQTITVTAAEHRLSFQGTGTVTLSGASTSGPLVGTGASDIVGLTFTPTAGSLTLTVSGTVEIAQLELGSSRSAYQRVVDAGRFHITETGQRPCEYLAPDGLDDWMSLASAFAPAGAYTTAMAIGRTAGVTMNSFGSSAGAAPCRFYTNNTNGLELWADGVGKRTTVGGLLQTRAAYVARVAGADAVEFFENGVARAPVNVAGAMTPVNAAGFNTLFRTGAIYTGGKFFGGALIPRALTDAERVLTENVFKYKIGL
jgi:hypothetical protein